MKMPRNGLCSRTFLSTLLILGHDATAQPPASRGGGAKLSADAEASHQERAAAIARERLRRYMGTRVWPDPKAGGGALTLQTQIATLLRKQDYVPELRRRHYRWMYESENTPITGWDGTILSVTPDRDGAIVTVRFHARSDGGFCNLSTTTERYRYSDGRLRFNDLVYKPGVSTWN